MSEPFANFMQAWLGMFTGFAMFLFVVAVLFLVVDLAVRIWDWLLEEERDTR